MKMTHSMLDRQFAQFVQRHRNRCGTVSVRRAAPISRGLTLTVSCSCGVSSEWELMPGAVASGELHGLERRTA